MCPQNYHRELLTLCKYGGNQTLTIFLKFSLF
jgi:hypothetical protein